MKGPKPRAMLDELSNCLGVGGYLGPHSTTNLVTWPSGSPKPHPQGKLLNTPYCPKPRQNPDWQHILARHFLGWRLSGS